MKAREKKLLLALYTHSEGYFPCTIQKKQNGYAKCTICPFNVLQAIDYGGGHKTNCILIAAALRTKNRFEKSDLRPRRRYKHKSKKKQISKPKGRVLDL